MVLQAQQQQRILMIMVVVVFDPSFNTTISYANLEGNALHILRTNLIDPNNVLQSWDPTLANPCTWFHITCNDDDSVVRVDLGNAGLSGQLVPQLDQLKNLKYLRLHSNNISGKIPGDLGNLKNLLSLDLYLNSFVGSIPETLGKLRKLRFLRLNNNSLTGPIPMSLTNATALQVLDLSNNRLSGPVPENGSFSRLTLISSNNLDLCGPVTGKPCPGSKFSGNSASRTKVIVGVVAGATLLFATSAIGFVKWHRRGSHEHFFDIPAEEDMEEVYLPQLKKFSLPELRLATDNFNITNSLGRGGFGEVYKGRLANGSFVAVKRLIGGHELGKKVQFQTEVQVVGMAVHRNLLHLSGFCTTPTESLLVYPYMANGSLADRLREHPLEHPLDWLTRKKIALGSARGLSYLHDHCDPKIIHRDIKAANVLLDEEFEAVVSDFGLAKLMDYEDTQVTTAVRGTVGHIAPEYYTTGKSSEKTDVFGYGIMLLEIITGRKVMDLVRQANENGYILLHWVKKLLTEKNLDVVVDPIIVANDYVEADVEQMVQISLLCCQSSPKQRPKMAEVVRMLEGEGLAERWEKRQMLIEFTRQRHEQLDDGSQIAVSAYDLNAVELSGPR